MGDMLLLIDGSSLLTTQFFGNLPREILYAKTEEEKAKYYHKIMMTSGGVYTNAVFGFLRTLIRILKEQKPSHIAVAWDLTRDTFRRRLYPEYKGNRSETMPPLSAQFSLCEEILDQLGFVQFMDPEFEADDFCGTAASRFENEIPVRILTKDNDYLQLVTERTNLWMMHSTAEKTEELLKKYRIDKEAEGLPDRVFCYTPELVEQEFGVPPCHINSLKGLMGDSSDHIKGVPGIGPDTAVKLIREYGTVEALYAAVGTPDAAREKELKRYWKEALGLKRSPLPYLLKESDTELVGKKSAELSELLATIRRDAPLSCTLEDLRTNIRPEAWREVLNRLEFHSLKADFEEDAQPQTVWDENSLLITESAGEAVRFFDAIKDNASVSVVFSGERSHPAALTVYAEGKCAYLPVSEAMNPGFLSDLVRGLQKKAGKIYVPDAKAFYHAGGFEEASNLRDIGIAAYLLDPLRGAYPVEEIAASCLDWHFQDYQSMFGKLPLNEAVRTKQFPMYCGRCAAAAALAGPVLEERLAAMGMEELYLNIEMALAYDLYRMERTGILVRREALKEYGEKMTGSIAALEAEIHALAGEHFNILSPKQLGEILFEKLKLPYGKKTKSGYSTSADVLERLREITPIADKVLQYRQLTKLKSTYAEGLAACISEDGRIHGTFNQTVTATGRISSTEPNLQNIPVRMELGREIRKVFVPAEGCIFLDADYSQIELRILAHLSGDQSLIQAYRSSRDIHAITASQVFHVPLDEVTPLQRRNAKAVNFGIVYGISAFGLSEDLSISRKEATEYIERYFETYPGVKAYLDRMVETGRKEEAVRTMYGRIRPIPELKSANFMQRQFGERVAMNSPIQGTAADIMKLAMIRVSRRLAREGLKTRIVLQIHDELLLETPVAEKEKAAAILREEMQSAADLSVPLDVSLSEGASWYDAK